MSLVLSAGQNAMLTGAGTALSNMALSQQVSDALLKLGHPHGGFLPDVNFIGRGSQDCPTVCAPAYTVKMVSQKDTDAPKPSQHFVDAAQPGSIMVVSAPLECKNAVWGGLMSAAASVKGVQAVVISGRCRDLAEHVEYKLPVFSRGHSTLGQSPFTRPSELQQTLTLASDEPSFPAVSVSPGDIVLADENGVVFVPASEVEEVIRKAQRGEEVDALCRNDILEGRGVAETFKRRRG